MNRDLIRTKGRTKGRKCPGKGNKQHESSAAGVMRRGFWEGESCPENRRKGQWHIMYPSNSLIFKKPIKQ